MILHSKRFGGTLLVLYLALALALPVLAPAQDDTGSQPNFPPQLGAVSDHAQILSAEAEAELVRMAAELEARTSVKVLVATVRTTAPLAINKYGSELTAQWNLAMDGADTKTLLVLVAVEDGFFRLITSKGLEEALPDAQLRKISKETITPAFAEGEFERGIRSALQRVSRTLEEADRQKARGAEKGPNQGAEQDQDGDGGGTSITGTDVLGILLAVGGLALFLGALYLVSLLF